MDNNDDIVLEDVVFDDENDKTNDNDSIIDINIIYGSQCPICGKVGKKVRELYTSIGFLKKRHYLIGYKSVCDTCGFVGNYSAYRNLDSTL